MLEQKITHHIQKSIMHILLLHDTVRYSDLKPAELESNIFMYHLNQLIKTGLVQKDKYGYSLTRDGKLYASRSNLQSLKIRIQPKVITILTIQRDDGQWLLLKRKHQPNLNYVGFPSGKIHFGETLEQAAQRELLEKANITTVPLTFRGNLVMRFLSPEDAVVNHIIGYVFSGTAPHTLTTTNITEYFESFWGDESKLFEKPSFQGHQQLLDLLQTHKNNQLFAKEYAFKNEY